MGGDYARAWILGNMVPWGPSLETSYQSYQIFISCELFVLRGFFFFLQPSVLAAVSSLLSENISYKFNIFVVSFCIDFHFFFLSLSPSPHPQHPTG